MIRHSSATTSLPTSSNLVALDDDGRLYMLATLSAMLLARTTLTPDDFRTAYGRAADYQTVANARQVLRELEVAS